jgi:hypothetical protein
MEREYNKDKKEISFDFAKNDIKDICTFLLTRFVIQSI